MNIVVLGATSAIGSEIALAFASQNQLLLAGRNEAKLAEVAESCRQMGASQAIPLRCDLRQDWEKILHSIPGRRVHLLINCASATSRLRDSEIAVNQMADYAAVDLLAPLRLAEHICSSQNGQPLSVIFISTILTLVRSPNRSIYSHLKLLQEQGLKSLIAAHSKSSLLVVRVGKVLPPEQRTRQTARLARAVKRAFEEDRTTLIYGTSGKILTALFFTQPLVFNLAVKARRFLLGR